MGVQAISEVSANLEWSPRELEELLVVHYLRSDGPSGGAPLTFIDATPAEIATATGLESIDEGQGQRAFLDHFSHEEIHDWLSGATRPPLRDRELPGYFRYLLLTALVSATDTGAGSSHNFRLRLGELLNSAGRFNSVSGVNALWKELSAWCERKRAAGEPYRKLVLPDYGNANLIGYAVKIAFPSWRDRGALAQILRRLPPVTRRSPERLVQELTRDRYAHVLPNAVAVALADFETALRAQKRMLLGHRFWRLVQSVDANLFRTERGATWLGWRLEARFGGYEQDIARLALHRGKKEENPEWEGALQELETLSADVLPKPLFDALQQGALIFTEIPGMIWVFSDQSPAENASAIVIARKGGPADHWPIDTQWQPLEGAWNRSGRVSGILLTNLCKQLGLAPANRICLVDLTIDGGIKLGRSIWLGRPGFLPSVTASPISILKMEAVPGTTGRIAINGSPPRWGLSTDEPLSGRWRIIAHEEGLETEKVLGFERNAVERWEFPELSDRLELERDVAIDDSAPDPPLIPVVGAPAPSSIDDILEAVYAGPPNGWRCRHRGHSRPDGRDA